MNREALILEQKRAAKAYRALREFIKFRFNYSEQEAIEIEQAFCDKKYQFFKLCSSGKTRQICQIAFIHLMDYYGAGTDGTASEFAAFYKQFYQDRPEQLKLTFENQ